MELINLMVQGHVQLVTNVPDFQKTLRVTTMLA